MNDFCIIFFKKISILNALHVFFDEIFFNFPHELQAFCLSFAVNFAHTRVIGLAISTNFMSLKVVGISICKEHGPLTHRSDNTDSQNSKLFVIFI